MLDYIHRTYKETEDYSVRLEWVEGYVFAHVTLDRCSRKIIRELEEIWMEILARFYFEGFEYIYSYSQDDRMLRIFKGGKVLEEIDYHGDKYKIVEFDLSEDI